MIPDKDDQAKRVLLVLQAKFEERGTTMDEFEKSHGYESGSYITRLIAGKRGSPTSRLMIAMVDYLALPSAEFPFGITGRDFEPIQERLLERQMKVVGEDFRDDVDVKSINWKGMTPKRMEKLVWEYPSSVVGLMCGISDVAIGKYCKKHEIEKPPRGYWQKQGRYKHNPSGR